MFSQLVTYETKQCVLGVAGLSLRYLKATNKIEINIFLVLPCHVSQLSSSLSDLIFTLCKRTTYYVQFFSPSGNFY